MIRTVGRVSDEQRAQLRRRVRRLEWDECPARFQDAEQSDHQFRRSFETDADKHVGAHPVAAQEMGQLV